MKGIESLKGLRRFQEPSRAPRRPSLSRYMSFICYYLHIYLELVFRLENLVAGPRGSFTGNLPFLPPRASM
jgi:hypothetical protein